MTAVIQVVSLTAVGVVLVATMVDGALAIGDQITIADSSLADVAIGMTVAFISFVAFESSAALGIEAREPTRMIPRLLFLLPLTTGIRDTVCALIEVPATPRTTGGGRVTRERDGNDRGPRRTSPRFST